MKGSHNTLTFAKPVHWYHRLFSFVWKCQDSAISHQILAGVRCFDIRFAPATSRPMLGGYYMISQLRGRWRGAHGAVDLKIDPIVAIEEIAATCPGSPYVRLILEKGDDFAQANFIYTCRILRDAFPSIVFFAGYYKPTWRQLFPFYDKPSVLADEGLEQYVGSMQSNYGKVFPRLWRSLHPGLPRHAKHAALPAVLLDFVEL